MCFAQQFGKTDDHDHGTIEDQQVFHADRAENPDAQKDTDQHNAGHLGKFLPVDVPKTGEGHQKAGDPGKKGEDRLGTSDAYQHNADGHGDQRTAETSDGLDKDGKGRNKNEE